MTTQKDRILLLLKEEDRLSANEIAEATKALVTTVRSIAARHKIVIPTLYERVKDLLQQRDDLIKELDDWED